MDPFSFLAWRFYYFFRDPPRQPPPGRVLLSPADGYLLYTRRVKGGEVPSPIKKGVPIALDEWVGAVPCPGDGTLIGIYMTALDVHYIRSPVPGSISRVVPRPAKHENLHQTRTFVRLLWDMKPYEEDSRYITENARNTIAIDGEVPVVVVQIADRYVHECDSFVSQGEAVAAGQKIGMIRMGSQCDLYVPDSANVHIDCTPGEKVRAGETVLGTY
ncbi:MAG TPA: phosphatidylserine decarboxylase [Polyangiaceae bacterium]|jgi:phosphatidylserine decarboxylase|nr:phosphatidylserine decarboxylase [Polyangiaceae bacterium]